MRKIAASHVVSWMASVLCAVLPLAPSPAAAAETPAVRFLSPAAAADGTITYAVGTDVDLLLPFTATGEGTLEFHLLPFRSEHGDGLSVRPSIVELPDVAVKEQRLLFPVDRPILTLRLQGPALPTSGRYTGALAVVQQGKVLQTNHIVLTRAAAQRPAKMTVDPKSVVVYQTGSSDKATFRVQATNASAEWQADGVFLRLLEVTAPAGTNFDPARHLRLTWNGEAKEELWRSPPAGSTARSIAPSRQAEIGGELVGVAPGEYTVKVGLGAANATVEGDQQITLKLHVKHGIGLPIFILLIAILTSWFATKGMEAQRRRASQLKKIADIQQDWLREEPAPLPTVAARAILKQAEDRNRNWFKALLGQDTTSTRIDKAELLLRILARVRGIRARAKSAAWSSLIRNRANKELARITGSLDPGTVDESAAKKLEAGLDELDHWFDSKRFDEQYWSVLKDDMESLTNQIRPENFTHHNDLVKGLREKLLAAMKERPTGAALAQVEESYAKLKVLWEREQEGDGDTLKTLGDKLGAKPGMGIEEFFREADGIAWSKLRTADFEFTAPAVNELDPARAYQLIRFEVAPTDRSLGRNYLFKHKLEYVWTLDFQKAGGRLRDLLKKNEGMKQLTQGRTNEPCVVQYVPEPGTLRVSVSLRYNDKTLPNPIVLESLRIRRSREYGWLSAFRVNEVIAVVIAALAATLSGLMTYYLNKPAFGSLGDYITLFIWGAGVDQTKNFIQNLERPPDKG